MKERDPIPPSDNIQELAEFWQTHSVTDYEDLMEEVSGPLLAHKDSLKVLLKPEETQTLQKMAEAEGVSPAELVHTWVAQKITRHKNAKQTKR